MSYYSFIIGIAIAGLCLLAFWYFDAAGFIADILIGLFDPAW